MAEATRKGTRGVFNSWLLTKKGMTYSKYSGLPTEKKLAIQKEYHGKGRVTSNEPGQSHTEREGEATTV